MKPKRGNADTHQARDAQWTDWIAQIACGDEAALCALYHAALSRVYGAALRIVRVPAAAEEVVEDVFMQVWRTAAAFDPARGNPVAWFINGNFSEPVIDAGTEQALLSGLAPIDPGAAARARILGRVLHNLTAAPQTEASAPLTTVRGADGQWVEIGPGIQRKRLMKTAQMHAALYRMAPGSFFPSHDHASDEECICLEGEVDFSGTIVQAGDFHFAPRGVPHALVSSPKGCLLYIRRAA